MIWILHNKTVCSPGGNDWKVPEDDEGQFVERHEWVGTSSPNSLRRR